MEPYAAMESLQNLTTAESTGPGTKPPVLLAAASILIVESVDVDAGIAVSALSANPSVTVKVVPDGPSALQLLAESPVRLILLGVEEDEQEATELLRELKAQDKTSRIPVIVLALPVPGRALDHWYELGAAAVLPKPMRLMAHRELIRAIERFWLGAAVLPDGLRSVADAGETAGSRPPAMPIGADRDPMTGMLTRKRFEQELERELMRASRYGSGGAMLAIDLDNFRRINDTFGYVAGDDLLARVAGILRRRLRMTDTTARLGDDEFGAILPGTNAAEAVLVAQSLLALFHNTSPAGPDNSAIPLTASIGVAPFHGAGELSANTLLVEADIALCDAKAAGRDRVVVFDSEHRHAPLLAGQPTWPERAAGLTPPS
jgi:diguanylate cyclase (GGDEF)-like protein